MRLRYWLALAVLALIAGGFGGLLAAKGLSIEYANAAAAMLVALATVGLGVATFWLGRSTEASVREIRESRDIEWRPYLTVHPFDPGIPNEQVIVANMGKGPALNAYFVWSRSLDLPMAQREQHAFGFDMGAGGDSRGTGPVVAPPVNEAWIEDVLTGTTFLQGPLDPIGKHVAAVCDDQFGNAYRFRLVAGEPVPDVWKRFQRPIPDWVYWPPRVRGTQTDPEVNGSG